jgi:3-oxoacyl-[acyl-carrier-protein] synthase-3
MEDQVRAAMIGTGSAVPDKVMTNADFEKFLDTSDEWITKRTGIKQRHICREQDTTATLATQAAKNALDDAGVSIDDIDLILCATISPEMPFPATACFVQDALGGGTTPAMDISAACSGFINALTVGDQFIRAGTYKRVLVIGVDCLSRFSDFTDRGSCILFGDGAGAAVLEATDQVDTGIQYTVLHTDGSGWDYIHVPAGGTRLPASHETVEKGQHYVKMRGRDVYKFAVEKMQWLLGDCMSACDLTVDDVDMVVPHQVNIRIITSAIEKHNFPMEKIYVNIDRYGNTSAASIPLALDEARRTGQLKPGSTMLLVAFGAGLTWAGAVVKM